jgi:hypothetical protein
VIGRSSKLPRAAAFGGLPRGFTFAAFGSELNIQYVSWLHERLAVDPKRLIKAQSLFLTLTAATIQSDLLLNFVITGQWFSLFGLDGFKQIIRSKQGQCA